MDIQSLELDVACYATAVYHEVNTRTLEEKVGVINVIRNRLHSGRWGNSVCAVVYARGQFIGVTDASHPEINTRAYLETKLLVLDTVVFNKYANPVGKSLHFHDDSIKSMGHAWGKKMVKIKRMTFY
jgi:spore germination cell wall hydrolase CwlJ-like protein